jgi:hypothetical protein
MSPGQVVLDPVAQKDRLSDPATAVDHHKTGLPALVMLIQDLQVTVTVAEFHRTHKIDKLLNV